MVRYYFVLIALVLTRFTTIAQFGQLRILLENQLQNPQSSVITDLDQDGDLEIIVASIDPAGIVWYEQRDDHTFNDPVLLISEPYLRILTLADIDGDGDEDLIGAGYGPNRLMWWPRNGAAFGDPQMIDSSVDQLSSLMITDLDMDGDMDIVATGSADQSLSLF